MKLFFYLLGPLKFNLSFRDLSISAELFQDRNRSSLQLLFLSFAIARKDLPQLVQSGAFSLSGYRALMNGDC